MSFIFINHPVLKGSNNSEFNMIDKAYFVVKLKFSWTIHLSETY